MIVKRADQIISDLAGLGTDPCVGYTNREIIDKLIELEKALLAGVYEKNHAENMRPQDLTKHFSTLAKEFGLLESDAYKRFSENMDLLVSTIKTLKKGTYGENVGRYALKPLSMDKGVKVLYNIALDDGEFNTEYDAIVIAPYGLFVVEVKNWGGELVLTKDGFLEKTKTDIRSNIAARMVIKETLLKGVLEDLFPRKYLGILLFPEDSAKVQDEYHSLPFCHGASISSYIRRSNKNGTILTHDKIKAIEEKLLTHHKEQYTYCDVKCDEIIEDYALIMAQIEAASHKTEQDVETVDAESPANVVRAIIHKSCNIFKIIEPEFAVRLIAEFGLSLASAYAASQIIKHRHNLYKLD